MAIVERGNVVLEVADDDVDRYINKGYSLTDGHGNVLRRAIPRDVGELQHLVVKYEAEIKELKKQLEEQTASVVVEPQKRTRRKKTEE